MLVGRTWRQLTALAAATLCTACYSGLHRTNEILVTEDIDPTDNEPASDLSATAHSYDLVVGRHFGKLDVFLGFGAGIVDVYQRTRMSADGDTPVQIRLPIGAAYRVHSFESFDLAASAIYTMVSDTEAIDESVVGDTFSVAAQISTKELTDKGNGFIPVVRLGVSTMSGTASARGYVNADGGSEFSGLAAMITVGANYNISLDFDD